MGALLELGDAEVVGAAVDCAGEDAAHEPVNEKQLGVQIRKFWFSFGRYEYWAP